MQSGISRAKTIPAYFYTCPDHFKKEIRNVFYRNWLHVGRLDQVREPGDYLAGKIHRQPYVVTRTEKGELRAYDNVCRHHGTTLLAKGCGNLAKKEITCCYHGWTYNLEGKLIRATRLRGIEDFRAKDNGLQSLRVKTMGQLVFLYLSANSNPKSTAEDADGKFVNIEDNDDRRIDFDKLRFVATKTYDLNCNWKVFVDNYLDGGYHLEYAHKGLASNLDLKTYKTVVYDRHSVQSVETNKTSGKMIGGGSGRIGNAGNPTSTFTWIYPNLMLNRYGKWLDTNTVFPIDTERCRVVFDWYIEKDTTDNDNNDSRNIEQDLMESNRVQDEDEELCVKVQEGMHSQFFHHGRYAPNVETGMYHFHDLLLKELNLTVEGC